MLHFTVKLIFYEKAVFEGGGAKRKGDLLECWRLEQIPPAPLQKGGKAKSGLSFNPRCLKL
jgi:hypothetical protein